MLVVGDKEAADGTVAVRSRVGGDQGAQKVAAFIEAAMTETQDKKAVPQLVNS
jgi:threonyl-tRNA synthetase